MRTIKIKRRVSSTILKIKELELFKGKRVELEIKVKELKKDLSNKNNKSISGAFSKYANGELKLKENVAWELAVKEKHENYRR